MRGGVGVGDEGSGGSLDPGTSGGAGPWRPHERRPDAGPSPVDAGVRLRELVAAMESMDLAVMVRDPDDALVLVNRAFMRLLGYSRDEAVGRTVSQLFREDQVESVRECGAAIRAGLVQGYSGRIIMMRGDGSTLRVRFHTTMLMYGGEKFLISFLEDWSDFYWAAPQLVGDAPAFAPVLER